MYKFVVCFVVSFLLLMPLCQASADDTGSVIQRLDGLWIGTSNSAVLGSGFHHPGTKEQEKDIRFTHILINLNIDKQDGQNFTGLLHSKHFKETILGALSPDSKSGVMVDEDGSYRFTLTDDNTMNVCYTQVNHPSMKKLLVASCYDLHRQKGERP